MKTTAFIKKYYIDRSNSQSIKWSRGKKLGCLPMWIADMDFKCDERVTKALKDFIQAGDYGYANLPEDYYRVFIDWHEKRNGVSYKQEWIRFTRGAVNAMFQVLHSLTQKNDAVMINTPLYPPFKAAIKNSGRKVIESPLQYEDGYFTFNYRDIEKKFKTRNVKMLMLCSPHNPLGRVWKKGELEELFELCHKYHVLVCADEVHSDIIMPDQEFVPALSLKKYQKQTVSIIAASKSFSLAVFSHCHVVIPDKKLRDRFIRYQQEHNTASVNVLNALPTYYNYLYGEEWLNTVNNVIFENYQYLKRELGEYLEMTNLEGSYLLFLNLGEYNISSSAAECLTDKCHILANPGESFGKGYENWVRLNLATSPENIKTATERILQLIKTK
ncbi:MAG: aminotransferase class I/II-fold pyridoxal phosphate-dependent enzyme [Erysipelotrichaceae bacterium]|nr:aminotransferase class I/II-fold pyridoxal phosphate-dependent enzyme [Erysipelotrichaceae bacterium]